MLNSPDDRVGDLFICQAGPTCAHVKAGASTAMSGCKRLSATGGGGRLRGNGRASANMIVYKVMLKCKFSEHVSVVVDGAWVDQPNDPNQLRNFENTRRSPCDFQKYGGKTCEK